MTYLARYPDRVLELPLAAPVNLAGVRLATIGAWIAAGGLGVLFNEGIAQDNPDKIQAGVLVIAILAIGLNQILLWLERWAGRWRTARG